MLIRFAINDGVAVPCRFILPSAGPYSVPPQICYSQYDGNSFLVLPAVLIVQAAAPLHLIPLQVRRHRLPQYIRLLSSSSPSFVPFRSLYRSLFGLVGSVPCFVPRFVLFLVACALTALGVKTDTIEQGWR